MATGFAGFDGFRIRIQDNNPILLGLKSWHVSRVMFHSKGSEE